MSVSTQVKAQSMVAQAYKQQQLTGRKDADVSFIVPGKWPASGNKRLLGKNGGPVGRCMAEYEDAVMCLFRADEVIRYLARFLPTVQLSRALATPPAPAVPGGEGEGGEVRSSVD